MARLTYTYTVRAGDRAAIFSHYDDADSFAAKMPGRALLFGVGADVLAEYRDGACLFRHAQSAGRRVRGSDGAKPYDAPALIALKSGAVAEWAAGRWLLEGRDCTRVVSRLNRRGLLEVYHALSEDGRSGYRAQLRPGAEV